MALQKVVIKIPLMGSDAPSLSAIGAEFTKWIQESSLPGVLIDVADYSHMHEGLGVILAGHEYILSLDQQEGLNGLRVAYRLNSEESLASRVKDGYELLQKAIDLLSKAGLPLKFNEKECWVGAADRLNVSASASEELLAACQKAFGNQVNCLDKVKGKSLPMIKVRL